MRIFIAVIIVLASLERSATCGEDATEKLMKDYEAAVQKANTDRDDKVKKLTESLVKQLQDEQTAATKRGDLDLALKIREQVKSVQTNAASGVVPSAPAANAISPTAKADDGKLKAIPAGSRLPATVYARACDAFTICINGQRILSGGESLSKKETTIAVGDIITIKTSINSHGHFGIACIIKAGNTVIPTSAGSWKSYTPKSDTQWSDLNQIGTIGAADVGDSQGEKDAVVAAANADCDAIWAKGQEKVSYLLLQVTKESFVPAK